MRVLLFFSREARAPEAQGAASAASGPALMVHWSM
ncbi:hypothetical protein MPC4_110065 [Methylocella tundrae]|uniref:Uncharacterized protein n=1 Tax=Methylocella tundrae TaxID=227605 RepID=A0A8B6M1Y0_METTU|nr:hypothetical protein MPC4_110065 [Methylocella tundrae]